MIYHRARRPSCASASPMRPWPVRRRAAFIAIAKGLRGLAVAAGPHRLYVDEGLALIEGCARVGRRLAFRTARVVAAVSGFSHLGANGQLVGDDLSNRRSSTSKRSCRSRACCVGAPRFAR